MKSKLFLTLTLAMLFALPATAQKATIDGIIYEIQNGQAQITDTKKATETVEIPATVEIKGKDYPVTAIAPSAFEGNWGIKTVRLPESVTSIGYAAFRNCAYLQEVVLPSTLKSISENTFQKCTALTTAVLPAALEEIGASAFEACDNLQLVVPPTIKRIAGWSLGGHVTLTLPEGVTNIPDHAWGTTASTQSKGLDLPDGGTISGNAFVFCKSIKIILPNTLKRIGEYAFYSLGDKPGSFQIVLPESLQSIGEGAFRDAQLSEITIPASVKVIGRQAFFRSTLQKIHILGATDIYTWAFEQCQSLEEAILSPAVNTGDRAFDKCHKLKRVEYTGSVPPGTKIIIDDYAFQDCDALQTVILPPTLTKIGERAFGDCKNLTEVKGLHAGITFIYGDYGINPFTGTPINLNQLQQTFSFHALGTINRQLMEWMQKKEFETTAQWQERVTVENRDRKLQEWIAQAEQEYIAQADKSGLTYALGNYDADYETYSVDMGSYGKLHVSVPRSEAPAFKAAIDQAAYTPTFGVKEDHLAVTALTVRVNGKTYQSRAVANEAPTDLALNLPPLQLDFGNTPSQQPAPSTPVVTDNSLDLNIPTTNTPNPNTFAVIIGNEHYQRVAAVPYALNDANTFAAYCEKTLGIPHDNIRLYKDATFGTLLAAISDLQNIGKVYNGDIQVLFYYAGHGIPDDMNRSAYLLPVDADGQQKAACYSLEQLYQELGNLNARFICVFLDACFSGAQRGEGMLATARGVAIKPKASTPGGNVIVFSAATGDETAYPYDEKGHGLFTYFLLKKLQENKGNVTLGELSAYLQEQVGRQAVIVNRKPQTPTVSPSPALTESWKGLKLK